MVEKDRFVIERHILRAIRNTPRGEKIIISAYSLDRQVFADELIRAHIGSTTTSAPTACTSSPSARPPSRRWPRCR